MLTQRSWERKHSLSGMLCRKGSMYRSTSTRRLRTHRYARLVRKMAKNWPKIISRLKDLIAEVGAIWPGSTKLAGFASKGPYHCANCEYLTENDTRCNQEVMKADSEVDHDEKGLAIITDAEHQCCEFVEPKKLVQIGSEYKR